MGKTKKQEGCCAAPGDFKARCRMESLIGVDERGQMVLPKEVREKAGINSGDKLAIVSWEQNGKVCCISLIKAGEFADMVKGLLGPMMKEITK